MTTREYNFGEPSAWKQLLIRAARELAKKIKGKQLNLKFGK